MSSAPVAVLDMETLYRQDAGRLRAFVRRLTADRGLSDGLVDAEGVVQEAFEALMRYRYEVLDPWAWLCSVARRLVSKAAAASRRIDAADATLCIETSQGAWHSMVPRADLDDILAARDAVAAITALPNRQKTAAWLSVAGWSHAEIGAYLGCKPATVGVHIHRGTKRVRAAITTSRRRFSTSPTCGLILALLTLGMTAIELIIRPIAASPCLACDRPLPPGGRHQPTPVFPAPAMPLWLEILLGISAAALATILFIAVARRAMRYTNAPDLPARMKRLLRTASPFFRLPRHAGGLMARHLAAVALAVAIRLKPGHVSPSKSQDPPSPRVDPGGNPLAPNAATTPSALLDPSAVSVGRRHPPRRTSARNVRGSGRGMSFSGGGAGGLGG